MNITKVIKATSVRLYSFLHCSFVKIMHPLSFSFYPEQILSPFVQLKILDKGKIKLGRKIGMRNGCVVSASDAGVVILGNGCFLNKDCMIIAHEKIEIGENSKLGPGVMVYDHDYDFKNQDILKRKQHLKAPIIIGNNVWIGAGSIILRGSVIGDNCVVGAGSVIKGHYKAGTLIIQKRNEITLPIDE